MNIFHRLTRRIEPCINNLVKTKSIRYIPVIILFNSLKDTSINRKLTRAGFKSKWELPFINGICGLLPSRNIEEFKKIIEIKKIYYDGKAKLMGWIDANPGKYESSSYLSKSSSLSGKGVSIAFIDSGVYPHKALVSSIKNIKAFKDFINNVNYPYDDSGHGTACIGAACGFLPHDNFIAPAFNSSVICAKTFDMSCYGFYSDILAAMQWILDIKEKYNIKITVMPFGVERPINDFDILSLGAETMCQNNILVVTCAGNLGPHSGTITSPGHNSRVLTIGAFKNKDNKPEILSFSSRGPGLGSLNKPDAVMNGYFITSLSSDTSYQPEERNKFNHNPKKIDYIRFSGTSAAVSQAAAAAAWLYEKKGDISPNDAKSIIKLCTTSLGEIKIAQGGGFIDFKKIEDA